MKDAFQAGGKWQSAEDCCRLSRALSARHRALTHACNLETSVVPLKHAVGWRLLFLLLLMWPIYQIIGTARHELSHAVMARWQGATITGIHVLPSWRPGAGLYWGSTSWSGGHTTWLVGAAPYFYDLLTALLFTWICSRLIRRNWWLWFHCWAFGLWSPLLNSACAYLFGIRPASRNDVASVMRSAPKELVHLWFIVTLAFYAFAVWSSARSRRAHDRSAGPDSGLR
jgi:hypothetical protein